VDPERRAITAYTLIGEAYEIVAEAADSATYRAAPFPDLVIDLTEVWE
jgi:hypothetical protein